MNRLAVLLAILVAGAAILAPVIMLAEPDPLPGDFILTWNNTHYQVSVLWSLRIYLVFMIVVVVYKILFAAH